MPYVSKAERDAASKMTRSRVLKHIQEADQCDEQEALRQMANAIGDGMLPVRWDDERSPYPNPGSHPETRFPDRPPTEATYWLNAKVDPSGDRIYAAAPYDRAVNKRRAGRLAFPWRFRRPLFQRVAVIYLWPTTTKGDQHQSKSSGSQSVAKFHGRRGGRPSARQSVFETLTAMKHDRCKPRKPIKKIAEEVARRNGHKLGDPGWHQRTIEQHVSNWLSEKHTSHD